MDIIQTLAQELDKNPQHVKNVVQLLDEKIAVMDSVDARAAEEWLSNVAQVLRCV